MHNRCPGIIRERHTRRSPVCRFVPSCPPIGTILLPRDPLFSQRILEDRDLQITIDHQTFQLGIFFCE